MAHKCLDQGVELVFFPETYQLREDHSALRQPGELLPQ